MYMCDWDEIRCCTNELHEQVARTSYMNLDVLLWRSFIIAYSDFSGGFQEPIRVSETLYVWVYLNAYEWIRKYE